MYLVYIVIALVSLISLVSLPIVMRRRVRELPAKAGQATTETLSDASQIMRLLRVGDTERGAGQGGIYRDAPVRERRGIAFVSYNLFEEGLANGWYERNGLSVFVMQNTKGERWGQDCGRRNEIERQWSLLDKSIDAFDRVYVYVGQHSTRAIEFANRVPSGKVTFVLCDCGRGEKMETIRQSGHAGAPIIWCECGGHKKMQSLMRDYLEKGAKV